MLDKHYALPPINLSAREAALLVALGTQAIQLRWLPFTETVQAALDKVRGALSISGQRELLTTLQEIEFVGVPALSASPAVRKAIEEAWFSRAALTIHYRREEGSVSIRQVRIERVIMERSMTFITVVDVESGARRRYSLHRIERAVAVTAPISQQ